MERLGVLIWIFVVGFVFGSKEITKKPEIYSMTIYTDIKYRFATTKVTSRVKNPGDTVRESLFDVTLPNEAFITNLTLEIDDKIVLGEIKEKQEAKQQYEAARSRGESAGHIETKHRETNRFTLSISVAPMSKVTFNLTYQELLKRTHGYYEEVIYIDPGQPVPELEVTVTILESRNITKLTVPVESNQVDGEFLGASSAAISQTSPTSAIVKYAPTLEQQKTERESGLSGKFVVRYDVDRSMDAGDVMMVNGYFVHFFAPEGFKPIPSDVLFILDTSGSMDGTKMEQLKEAMLAILADMHEGDRMNILTFSGNCKLWRQEMVDIFDEDIRAETEEFIGLIRASGMTNIELAIRTGLEFMAALPEDKHRSRVMVFLTDGEATSGTVDDQEILKSIKRINSEARIPIFTLAFGQSADYDIVKRIAGQNNGFGRKIYEASDATMQIAGFYSEISVTLLNNITFNYLDVEEVTQTQFNNYFNGSEIIVCGAYRPLHSNDSNITDVEPKLNLWVDGISVEGPRVLLVIDEIDMDQDVPENLTSAGDFEQITEKVWAYLTIKQLLDKQVTSDNDTVKEEITARVLDLSLQYGFVTPLTSMVVTLPVSSQTGQNGDEAAEVVEDFTFMDSSMAIHGKSLGGSSSGGDPFARPMMAGSYYGSYNDPMMLFSYPLPSSDINKLGPVPKHDLPHSLHLQAPLPVKHLQAPLPVKTVSTTSPVTTVLAPLPLKPEPLPLTIEIPPKRRKYCFSLNVSPTANGNKTYRLFRYQDVAIHVMVSQSSKSSSDSNVTEVRVFANGMLKDFLTPQNDTDDMLDQQTNNCSIRIKKSNHTGLAIEATCGRDTIPDRGIIDTLASKLIKIKVYGKGMHASAKLTDENFLLMKHKAVGQKCWKFHPKSIIDLNDFLV